MQVTLEARVVCVLDVPRGSRHGRLIQTQFNLDASDAVDISKYLSDDDLPTKFGAFTLTNILIQGLIGNLHASHEYGHWTDHEHMAYITEELQRGFVALAEVGVGRFTEAAELAAG